MGDRLDFGATYAYFIAPGLIHDTYIHTYMCTRDRRITCLIINTYMKAVGNKGVIGEKMSSRPFCAAVQEDHLSSHLEKTRGPYAARVPLDFAPLSARGGHTNRHSECSPAQGF